MRDLAEGALRKACRITGAAWAALVGDAADGPMVELAHGLSAAKRKSLGKLLGGETGRGWYAGIGSKRRRPTLDVSARRPLGVKRLWGYSTPKGGAIVVGADTQRGSAQEVWSMVADLVSGRDAWLESPGGTTRLMGEEAYNSRHALEGILAQFLGMPEITGGWLAIRRGEQLIISAQSDAEVGMDASLELPSSPLMRRIRETRVGLVARRGGPDWSAVPHSLPPAARFWAAYPLVVRERFIGAIALWGERPLPSWRQVELGERAAAVSPQIDLVLSMAEVTSQLHRLATLNEFALAISSAEDFPRMTERVMTHLAAIFPAHRLALYVPSGEGTRMQEFRSEGETFRQVSTAMSGHIMARWFLVSGESANATRSPLLSAGEQLILPLRYREAIVGLLELRGSGTTEVSRYDQSMLAIVGSYMAGVVERNRLRFEATERARRLEETVQQLQQAELTASTRLAAQQSAESRLVQAAKLVAVGEMAAGVAHELNNPLTTVTGFAELILEDTPAGAPYRADLEMVLHEARRARSVVRRLLDFARQGEHLAARADMNEIVEDVLALMTHFIHTSGVQLEVELAPELPWIILDGNQMKQVLLNLLHNALHAMPGGGRLQVRTELQRKEARDWVVTHITDDGVGIDAAELERIFEPFYTTRAESGGTGLGLSVTYGIVSDHGGTIEVESQRGAGSTFSVWLPA